MKRLTAVFGVLMMLAAAAVMAMAPQPGGGMPPDAPWYAKSPLVPMLFIFGIFYIFMILPQQKQRKQRQALLDNLKRDDKVVTQGGFIATIVAVSPTILEVKLNDETRVKILRSAVTDLYEEKPVEPTVVK